MSAPLGAVPPGSVSDAPLADSPGIPRCCAIGKRQDASELSEAIRIGSESLGAIARRSGASKTSLIRHREKCLGLTHASAEPVHGPDQPDQAQSETRSSVVTSARISNGSDGFADQGGVEVSTTTTQRPQDNARAFSPSADNSEDARVRPAGPVQAGPRAPAPLAPRAAPRHRRPLPTCPDVLSGFEARATYIADLLSRAAWDRDAEAEHAVRWGVGAATIAQYKRAATVVLAADRGALREQVEVSVAYGMAQRDSAARMAERNEEIAEAAREASMDGSDDDEGDSAVEALRTETFALKHARDYRKLVLEWQQHLDTLTGVLVTKAPSVQINALVVAQTPEFEQVMRCVLDELQAAPKIRLRVIERVRAEIDKQRAEKALPVRRMTG